MSNICSTCKLFIKFLGNGRFVMCSDDADFMKSHTVRPTAEKLDSCNDYKVCNDGYNRETT